MTRVSSLLLLSLTVLTSLHDGFHVLSTPVRPASHRMTVTSAEKSALGFVCKPRERAYHLMDLMQSYGLINASESVNAPAYIVLMRCDSHSGCCDSHVKTCMPVPEHTYYTEVELRVASISSRMEKRWYRVEQHGECECGVSLFASERALRDAQRPIMEAV